MRKINQNVNNSVSTKHNITSLVDMLYQLKYCRHINDNEKNDKINLNIFSSHYLSLTNLNY